MPRPSGSTNRPKPEEKVNQYTYEVLPEPRTPKTGHPPLLPADEQVVTQQMDNGWSKAIHVGNLPAGDERPAVVSMDPAAEPVPFKAGKRNRRHVPVLPLHHKEMTKVSARTGLGSVGSLPAFDPPQGARTMPDMEERCIGGHIY